MAAEAKINADTESDLTSLSGDESVEMMRLAKKTRLTRTSPSTNVVTSNVSAIPKKRRFAKAEGSKNIKRRKTTKSKTELSPVIADDGAAGEGRMTTPEPQLSGAAQATTSVNPTATAPTKQPRASKRAPKPDPKPSDYPPRPNNLWKIGLHVTAAGGVENCIPNAAALGANAFALFLKSQRKWVSPPMKEESIKKFKERMAEFGYEPKHVLPHGNYLINLGNPDKEKRQKSYECFIDDLKRCEQLGLTLYNFHPGSTVGETTPEHCRSLIAECINRAHKETSTVITVLENMAGSGNVIGSAFSDLSDIIRQVENKERVAVCLDTCHMFAAGYDITSENKWNATMTDFDSTVGLSYLKGIHMNDSKTPLSSKKDRHESIGVGHLGLRTFHHILSDPRVQDIPIILETPQYEATDMVTKKEIEVLNRISGKPLTDEAEAETAKEVREAVELAVKAKGAKEKSLEEKRKTKRRKAKLKEDEDEDEDGDGELAM